MAVERLNNLATSPYVAINAQRTDEVDSMYILSIGIGVKVTLRWLGVRVACVRRVGKRTPFW